MSTLLKLSTPIPERIVQVPGGESFTVRGLSPLHVVALYKRHQGELEPTFVRVMASVQSKDGVNGTDLQSLLLSLISDSPALMGELIVIASGGDASATNEVSIKDPESDGILTLTEFDAALMIAMGLPFTTQVDALQKISELTFSQDMPLKKFAPLVFKLLRQVTGAMEYVATHPLAQNGSGESAVPSTS